MKIFSSNQWKVFTLTMAIIISITYSVFSFSGNWLKSIVVFVISMTVMFVVAYFVGYMFARKKDKASISKQQIWIGIIASSIVLPVVLGLVSLLMSEDSYTINFQRIIIAIVLSFVLAVIGNLLFIKEFRISNKELEN